MRPNPWLVVHRRYSITIYKELSRLYTCLQCLMSYLLLKTTGNVFSSLACAGIRTNALCLWVPCPLKTDLSKLYVKLEFLPHRGPSPSTLERPTDYGCIGKQAMFFCENGTTHKGRLPFMTWRIITGIGTCAYQCTLNVNQKYFSTYSVQLYWWILM